MYEKPRRRGTSARAIKPTVRAGRTLSNSVLFTSGRSICIIYSNNQAGVELRMCRFILKAEFCYTPDDNDRVCILNCIADWVANFVGVGREDIHIVARNGSWEVIAFVALSWLTDASGRWVVGHVLDKLYLNIKDRNCVGIKSIESITETQVTTVSRSLDPIGVNEEDLLQVAHNFAELSEDLRVRYSVSSIRFCIEAPPDVSGGVVMSSESVDGGISLKVFILNDTENFNAVMGDLGDSFGV